MSVVLIWTKICDYDQCVCVLRWKKYESYRILAKHSQHYCWNYSLATIDTKLSKKKSKSKCEGEHFSNFQLLCTNFQLYITMWIFLCVVYKMALVVRKITNYYSNKQRHSILNLYAKGGMGNECLSYNHVRIAYITLI